MIEIEQINSLLSVYQKLDSLLSSPSPPQSIYVQSTSNLDFTLELVQQLLRKNQVPPNGLPNFVQINLDEILSTRNLFQSILNQFANWYPPYHLSNIHSWNGQTNINKHNPSDFSWDYSQFSNDLKINNLNKSKGLLAQRKSNSFDGFCEGLRVICHQLSSSNNSTTSENSTNFPRFIIFNKPELMRAWKEFDILTSFTRLAELSGCSIHIVFVSCLPWPKLRPRYGALDPVSISIPRLSENDLVQILTHDGPPQDVTEIANLELKNHLKDIFLAFVNFIVATFNSQTSADLYELSILVNRLWPDWITRMDESGSSFKDTAKMILLSKPTIELEQKAYGSPVWHLPSFLTKPAGLEEPSEGISDDDEEMVMSTDEESTTNGSPKKKSKTEFLSPKKPSNKLLLLSPSKTRVNQLSSQTPFSTPSKPRHYLSIFSPSMTNPSSQPGSVTTTRHRFSTHLTPITPGGRIQTLKFTATSSIDKGPVIYQRQKTLDTLSLSLPIVARFLLVAAFIASFNPARTDLGLFLTSNDGIKKRKSRAPRKIQPGQIIRAKIRQRLLGPKMFTIGRLMAIFNAITDQEGVKFNEIDVLQQIGTLIQFKLLLKTNTNSITNQSSDKQLDQIKLIVSNLSSSNETQILRICDSLQFNLLNRMWESED
ncbi:hypothetical protein MJO29_008679 [Puccinia striiformis f. sp. tritici]|uniref:hypothetical protein n=1 Tax=Puccinia striiformis f. sp. tritici TaxID=168172 RepID=UPI002008054E|nr:hypothetical protein Pst134EA_015157 [Puccinia striiformis f. sp. tritici]KAH9463070.1 hypothetical protein Pst134EA_015157 [Puccinia striiformis f. sp. tritici]KAI7953048.1 hypothetical protein MJO29_008679 [Puccinia striiformis f. sp. tritici]